MNENNKKNVVVRYPPSPTGHLHIGNIRTILFNYLFAKHAERSGAKITTVLRFEDTDKERSDKKFEHEIIDTLNGLGIEYTEGPYRQSERTDLYVQAIQTLIDKGRAYEAEESNDKSGGRVVRFKNPNTKITFKDAVRGEITIDTTDFGDFIIARSLYNPLYHLTVVVDDIDMGVTDVIRGEDHITSTPRQILLIKALGGTVPKYAHLPLIIGEDKKKLSKRHGAITYTEFRKAGYLNEAIINHLALLGWSEGNDREFYTMEELIEVFSLKGVSKSPAMFSYHKLDSINKHYLSQLPQDQYEKTVVEYMAPYVKQYIQNNNDVKDAILNIIIKERINKWGDVETVCEDELGWLNGAIHIIPEKLVWKKSDIETAKRHLRSVISILENVSEKDWRKSAHFKSNDNMIKNAIWDYASENGRGDVLWPMRYALTGKERSPDPFIVSFVLGKQETLSRLKHGLSLLSKIQKPM